jgi:hypothetical protein
MFRDDRFLRDLHFGTSTDRLVLRATVRRWDRFRIVVVIAHPGPYILRSAPATQGTRGRLEMRDSSGNTREAGEIATGEIIELGVPFAAIGASGGTSLQFQVKVFHDGIERECYPESAPFELAVPGADAALANWLV